MKLAYECQGVRFIEITWLEILSVAC